MDTTPHYRGATLPGFCILVSPHRIKGVGMPGAQCTRSRVGSGSVAHALVTTSTPETPGIPHAMVLTAYLRALPGARAFLPPSSSGNYRRLDTSVEVSGPHDFSVRFRRRRLQQPSTSTASCPALVTLANAPLSGQDGRTIGVIWVFRKTESSRKPCGKMTRRAKHLGEPDIKTKTG